MRHTVEVSLQACISPVHATSSLVDAVHTTSSLVDAPPSRVNGLAATTELVKAGTLWDEQSGGDERPAAGSSIK